MPKNACGTGLLYSLSFLLLAPDLMVSIIHTIYQQVKVYRKMQYFSSFQICSKGGNKNDWLNTWQKKIRAQETNAAMLCLSTLMGMIVSTKQLILNIELAAMSAIMSVAQE